MRDAIKTNYFVIGLLFILVFLYLIIQFSKKSKEGFDVKKLENEINSTFKDKSFDFLGNKVNISLQDIRKFFNDAIESVNTNFILPVETIISDTTDKIKTVGERLNTIKVGMDKIFFGIGDEFVGLGDGLKTGFDDIWILLGFIGEYIKTIFNALTSFLVNFRKCFPYYAIDRIVCFFLNPLIWILNLPISLISQIRKDPQFYNKYKIPTKPRYIPWSNTILNKCYVFPVFSMKALKLKAAQISRDFNVNLPKQFQKGTDEIKYGGKVFLSAFSNNPLA